MVQMRTITGQDLRNMFSAATSWLEKCSSEIDALNVFPVPDGDTGTNMMLTMRATIDEAFRVPDGSATAVASAMAKGALMGARGSSGVILSQVWYGVAEEVKGKELLTTADFADALDRAAQMAYKGITNPVEGTMLTVMREAAAAAKSSVKRGIKDIILVLSTTVDAAKSAVANTPRLLKVLREAGVVDAGGQGIYTIFEGALRYLHGEMELLQLRKPQIIISELPFSPQTSPIAIFDEVPYGYCTGFILKGKNLDPEVIKKRLQHKGKSLIVVGDESAVRIHIHTLDPGSVLHEVIKLGTMHQVNIRNIDEQRRDFLELQKDKAPVTDTAIVVVASGNGLREVFTSLGAAAVINGDRTMNPSTKDILQAVETTPAEKVIILPNNKNVILTAEQVKSLTQKQVKVVPSKTIPQGITALLSFDYEADFEKNIQIMENAIVAVRTIEITRAIRSTSFNGLKIKRKQPVGLLDGDLVAVNDTESGVIDKLLTRLDMLKTEVITIYYGEVVEQAAAEQIRDSIITKYLNVQVELVHGGQPYYNYIISVE
jgi:DAK2 domain fusion protein YloV